MTTNNTRDWSNYIYMSNEALDSLRRAGVQEAGIDAMRETRKQYEADMAAQKKVAA